MTKELFEELINRLKVCSETRYPNRLWTQDYLIGVKTSWLNKKDELEARVIELEEKLIEDFKQYYEQTE